MNYLKKTLANGLTLITAPVAGTKAVTVLVLVKGGSRYEKKEQGGLFHFIEHLLFKGTDKRPTTLDISKELDRIGAVYNAFTAKDHTGYYIKAAQDKLELCLDILSDILFHSKLAIEEIERERGVILEEIKMYEDNPLMYIDDVFENGIFSGSSLGRKISGTRETVKALKRKSMTDALDVFYRPQETVLTLAGAINSDADNLVEEYFGFSASQKKLPAFPKLAISQKKPKVEIFKKETAQVQMALGFGAYPYLHPKLPAAILLVNILGGNMSSRLFIEVRERRGLAYFIKSDIASYQDTGYVIIQAGVEPAKIKKALGVILAELGKIKEKGITKKELDLAKENIKGHIILALEESAAVSSWYGKQELLTDKIFTPEQYLKKIFNVKISDIQRVARDLIKETKLNLALIGPYKSKEKFLNLLKL